MGGGNGGHFHTTARSSHLLASKVLFEERKCISNIMRVKYKYSSHSFSCESSTNLVGKKGFLNSLIDTQIRIESKDLWNPSGN